MIIYKITNLINGKIYIGQDSKNRNKYFGSGKIIKQAIKKNGRKNFSKDIIEYCKNKKELDEREKYWIKYYGSINPKIGYNITLGGEGNLGLKHTKETKKLFSKQRKGKNNPNYGGKSITEHQRRVLSECGKKRVGKKNTFYNHKHTNKTKNKISISNTIPISKKEINMIIKLYKQFGVAVISEKTGFGKHKIYNTLRKNNVIIRKAGTIIGSIRKRGILAKNYINVNNIDRENIINYYNCKLTMCEISKVFNLSYNKIRQIIKESGVSIWKR